VLVGRLLDAERRRDLARYRELLADDFTEQTDDLPEIRDAEDAVYAAARSWALAPTGHLTVDDIHETAGCVTVRYRLDDALPIGAPPDRRPASFLGYSIYETADGHIIRAAHFLRERDRSTTVTSRTSEAPPASSDSPRPRRRSRGRRLLGGLAVALTALLSEPLYAAPVVATTAWRNGALAFAIWAPIYFALGYAAASIVVRRVGRRAPVSWFDRWLRKGAERRSMRRIRRLVQAGTWLGFALSSAIFGGIVTTWLLMELGRRDHIRPLALASSAIFAVSFVGLYAGLASLVF
jgi:hypothetical protein